MINLRGPRKGIMGPWGHKYPQLADAGPGLNWVTEEVRWWTQWLLVSVFWWTAFEHRHRVLGLVLHERDEPVRRAPLATRAWLAGRTVGAGLGVPRGLPEAVDADIDHHGGCAAKEDRGPIGRHQGARAPMPQRT